MQVENMALIVQAITSNNVIGVTTLTINNGTYKRKERI